MCVDVMVMSSTCLLSFSGASGNRRSDVYMLNSVRDRTRLICRIPVFNWRCVDVLFRMKVLLFK